MSDKISGSITGLNEIAAQFADMPQKLINKALRKALQASVEVVGHEVQNRTPVGTGLLKSSVATKVAIDSKQGGAGVVGFNGNDPKSGIPNGVIALWVEIGHKLMSHGKKSERKELKNSPTAGNPFMRNALDATKDKALDVFVESLESSLPEVVKQ